MKLKREKCLLSDLKIGQSARIIKITQENKVIRRHLFDMGITRDTEVTVKRIAPFGDPITLTLRDYELCIRKCDLMNIEVEVIK